MKNEPGVFIRNYEPISYLDGKIVHKKPFKENHIKDMTPVKLRDNGDIKDSTLIALNSLMKVLPFVVDRLSLLNDEQGVKSDYGKKMKKSFEDMITSGKLFFKCLVNFLEFQEDKHGEKKMNEYYDSSTIPFQFLMETMTLSDKCLKDLSDVIKEAIGEEKTEEEMVEYIKSITKNNRNGEDKRTES